MNNCLNLDIRADHKSQGRRFYLQIHNETDVYLSVDTLAEQSSLSKRTIRDLLKDPVNPIPHYKVNGRVLIYWPEFKEWMQTYRVTGADEDLMDVLTPKSKR